MARKQTLPGFKPTMGYTLFYLCLIVLIPLSTLFLKSAKLSGAEIYAIIMAPRAFAAFKVSFACAFYSAIVNALAGLMLAWVLTRYRFFGKKLLDVLIDLPFALPTAVAGIALTAAYSQNGPVGSFLDYFHIKAVYNQLGITMALIFVGLPFVVRTVQPVLEDFDRDMEEAANSLGANRWQRFFYIILPNLMPALLTGFTLSFARSLGEYGSVVFISGNLPLKTEIVPLIIIDKLEQYEYASATAIAATMLVTSFVLFFIINLIQARAARYA